MQAQTGKTTCPYCGVGCGVKVPLSPDRTSVIGPVCGDENHPANFGKLCVKGSHLSETLSSDGRLLQPVVDGIETHWDDAISTVAERIKTIIDEHGPDAFAFYLSGQILTEDYYVANKLAKGFIGTANIDTNSRLCMASAVAGYKRAFGSDTVPCNYEDLEKCDLLIMVGSNAAWTHPILYQRIVEAKKNRPNMKVVVIDPRRTATCDIADLHLAIAPGSDAAIFNYLLTESVRQNCLDQNFIANNTDGFEAALFQAQATLASKKEVASFCDINESILQQLADWWCSKEKAVSFFSQGVNQSATGVDKANAIINCHLATGRIGKEGMGPFSITGQPNAMGGREVGGLANQLAAHMDFTTEGAIDLVQRFWQAPNMATKDGLKAVDLFQAIEQGTVKAVWIMSTNPMVSLPDTAQVQRALEKCELVVVSDCNTITDTTVFADVLIPATSWSEKDGTVTNSERRISRQRGLLPPPGEAHHDWQAICEVAKAMGFTTGFDYKQVFEIFAEHADLSGFENEGKRDFDISFYSQINQQGYEDLLPVQWPVTNTNPFGTARMFSNGRFYTENQRAQFIAIEPRFPAIKANKDYPFILNTGRIRDQWHTMTRTGKAAKLLGHIDQPYVEMSPLDAIELAVQEKQLIKLDSVLGSAYLRVKISNAQKKGQIFAPIHWTKQFASHAVVSNLIPQAVDPLSGQPESKYTCVQLIPQTNLLYGFAVVANDIATDAFDYWCNITISEGKYYEFAMSDSQLTTTQNDGGIINLVNKALTSNGVNIELGECIEYRNPINQTIRISYLMEHKLQAVFYFSPNPTLPDTQWLITMLEAGKVITEIDRIALLAGQPSNSVDKGKIICSCFNIGEKQVNEAIVNGAKSVIELGKVLKCGTNCGSCISELNGLIIPTSKVLSADYLDASL